LAILGIPYFSPTLATFDRPTLTNRLSYLLYALINFVAASLLSRWVYGAGPLQSLRKYCTKLASGTMFERLRRALVESFVGAIALGYALAQCILHFVNIFTAPVAGWITRNEYRDIVARTTALADFSLKDALPELIRFCLLLAVWYVLLRWLYFKPLKNETREPAPNPPEAA
jgi:hypothetical protein